VIALRRRFGRSDIDSIHPHLHFRSCVIAISLFILGITQNLQAFGSSGMYTTSLKFEYQYSDYDQYTYPQLDSDDPSIRYEYIDPYIVNFPEHRSLAKVVQSFGPLTTLDCRYEYSALTENKDQNRYYFRLDHDVTQMTTTYGAYQYLGISYDSPDSSASGGYMLMAGVKHDQSGWIKSEASFSYDHNRSPDGMLVETYMPMAQVRWSLNSVTAVNGRWDGYWSVSDSGTYPAHAFTVFLSRYLPTQTAVHLFMRYYTNENGVESIAPAFEIAQYVRWNLTLRLTYRFYRNRFEEDAAPDFIENASITSHSARAYVEWQVGAAMKLHFKLRRYISDQDIRMNTYLFGFEYEL